MGSCSTRSKRDEGRSEASCAAALRDRRGASPSPLHPVRTERVEILDEEHSESAPGRSKTTSPQLPGVRPSRPQSSHRTARGFRSSSRRRKRRLHSDVGATIGDSFLLTGLVADGVSLAERIGGGLGRAVNYRFTQLLSDTTPRLRGQRCSLPSSRRYRRWFSAP